MSVLLRTAVLTGGDVQLGFGDGRPDLALSLFWLRDHDTSEDALHPETQQRLIDTFQIPHDIAALAIEVAEGGAALHVRWLPDGRVSRYDALFLAGLRADPELLPAMRSLWDGASIATNVPQVGYAALMREDAVLKALLEQVERYGFCMVEGVPGTPDATRAVAERVAYIRMTIFGGYYDFTANLEHKDTAYTSMAIGPHTDGTYSLDAPGYQIFHCLAADCSGGDNLLIDGFKVGQIMQREYAEDYRLLSTVEIPGRYLDHARGIQLMARRPLFRHDQSGALVQVSYNNHDRAPFVLPVEQHRRFYRALSTFAALCARPGLHYRRRLLPGSVLLFDNWRLLHAREAYVGYRRLAGAYLNREDVESRLRVLRIRAGEAV
ncbi:MAG TPA: trimethyllysine dioxygenase [Steroidobacteraceae bacterium]|jgi:trimethyllysine dioxygenase|nr:trimethyllysine dioxygenase [Steroidobacteraceae bacterium]